MDQIIKAGVACRGEEMMTSHGRIFSASIDFRCGLMECVDLHLWQYEDVTERSRVKSKSVPR